MVKGLYTAWTAMVNEQHRMDVATNNLANSNTTGFKSEGSSQQTFKDQLALKIKDVTEPGTYAKRVGKIVPGVKTGEDYTNWEEGPMKTTENTWDLAISGKGFFAIEYTNKNINVAKEDTETEIMYTRDGNFTVDAKGNLVTHDGDFVLNAGGAHITVDPTKDAQINVKGEIIQDNQVVGNIGLYDFEDYNYLSKYGENLYRAVDGNTQIEATGRINQGFLEQSNVSVVDQMVNIINIQRHYEAASTMIQTCDNTLEIAVTQVGKL